jgi:hypothetical protein
MIKSRRKNYYICRRKSIRIGEDEGGEGSEGSEGDGKGVVITLVMVIGRAWHEERELEEEQ